MAEGCDGVVTAAGAQQCIPCSRERAPVSMLTLKPFSQAWKLDIKACVGEWSDKKLLIQFSMYYLLSTNLSKW